MSPVLSKSIAISNAAVNISSERAPKFVERSSAEITVAANFELDVTRESRRAAMTSDWSGDPQSLNKRGRQEARRPESV